MQMDHSAILILIDGLRPDQLAQADTPTIDALMAAGASTLCACTVTPSITLPCITSLFHSANPERHGITGNLWTPAPGLGVSLFQAIRMAGGSTASLYNWEQLRDLSPPGALDLSLFMANCDDPGGTGDRALTDEAVCWLKRRAFTFVFFYLGHVDVAGHAHGYTSARYRRAIENADGCVGRVLDVLPDDITVVLTSDHGGHERAHGSDADEDLTVPFVMRGPGIPAGRAISDAVRIIDVAPTIVSRLGLPAPQVWAGRVVGV
jgi:predicted AlkP superfamily pyrophosphatase or phosphodiesterase